MIWRVKICYVKKDNNKTLEENNKNCKQITNQEQEITS